MIRLYVDIYNCIFLFSSKSRRAENRSLEFFKILQSDLENIEIYFFIIEISNYCIEKFLCKINTSLIYSTQLPNAVNNLFIILELRKKKKKKYCIKIY